MRNKIGVLIQRLISLFTLGGKRKNGSLIVKDLAYATKLKTITNWQYTNPALYKTWLVFPKKQQISYLRQIRQGKMTTDQLEKQIQAYEDIISPAKFNFTVKYGIKFSAEELSAINNVAERLANAINNKENMLRYPNGFNITLPTEFTIRSSKATRGPIQMRREPGSGKYKPTPSNMAFPEGIATEQAKITVHVLPYAYAKKINPKLSGFTKGWAPTRPGSTEFYLVREHYSITLSGGGPNQLADIKEVLEHETAHIKDPATVASPKLRAKYDARAPNIDDPIIALAKKAPRNYKKNYYYHQYEIAANLAPVLAKITNNTQNILKYVGKKQTLAALDQLSKWAASGTNVTFNAWSMIPGNFTNNLDTTATYILTGNHFNMGANNVEVFFHEFKIENPTEHRKVLNKLARQIEALKQQVKDTKNLTPESVIKLKTLI